MNYFKQNVKGLNNEQVEILNNVFETSRLSYNELVCKYKNDKNMTKFDTNNEIVIKSENFDKLDLGIRRSVVGNFNINMENYFKNKNKDASQNEVGYRRPDKDFFIAFFGNMFSINYETNILTLRVNGKNLEFKISKNFAQRKLNCRLVRLHKTVLGFYLVYEFEFVYNNQILSDCNIQNKLSKNYAGIDIGMECLFAVYPSVNYNPLLISGRNLLSLNKIYDKKISKTEDKNEIDKIYAERNDKFKHYVNLHIKRLFDYLNYLNIKEIFIGNFVGVKDKDCSKKFFSISYYIIKRKIKDYGKKFGIVVNYIEESYTSKNSFYDNEDPVFRYAYKGERIQRDTFRTEDGTLVHADINGAANILRKAEILTGRKLITNRENILLKPFYLDLLSKTLKDKFKASEAVFKFLKAIYKKESTIIKRIEPFKYDLRKFVFVEFVAFDYRGHYDTVKYKYENGNVVRY